MAIGLIALNLCAKMMMSSIVHRNIKFRLGIAHPSYMPLKLAKNNHTATAVDQLLKILFSEKQISKIMQIKTFLQ